MDKESYVVVREISIKNMIWYVVNKWRLILCVMLLFGTIFGVRQYRIDSANAIANQNVVTPTIYEVRDSLTEADMQNIEIARNYTLQREAFQKYVEESIYMQIPYDRIALAKLQYNVFGVEEDSESYVLAYCNYVISGEIGEDIVEKYKLNIEPQSLAEVITVKSGVHDTTMTENTFPGFVVEIRHCTVEEAKELALQVQAVLQEYAIEVSHQMVTNQLQLENSSVGVVSDYNVLAYQRNIIEGYESAIRDQQSAVGNLNANQRMVYDNWDELMNGEATAENDVVVAEPQPISVSINKTQIILGALIGLFLSVIGLMVYYIGTKKVRDASDFDNLSIEILGEVEEEKKRRKIFGFVDGFLNRIQYSNEKGYTHEKRMEMLATSILLKCSQYGTKEVYLTGSVVGEGRKELADNLQELLKEKEIRIVTGENIARNADSLMKAAEIKNIVLMEAEHGSFFTDVAEEIRVCNNHELKVLGGILVRA